MKIFIISIFFMVILNKTIVAADLIQGTKVQFTYTTTTEGGKTRRYANNLRGLNSSVKTIDQAIEKLGNGPLFVIDKEGNARIPYDYKRVSIFTPEAERAANISYNVSARNSYILNSRLYPIPDDIKQINADRATLSGLVRKIANAGKTNNESGETYPAPTAEWLNEKHLEIETNLNSIRVRKNGVLEQIEALNVKIDNKELDRKCRGIFGLGGCEDNQDRKKRLEEKVQLYYKDLETLQGDLGTFKTSINRYQKESVGRIALSTSEGVNIEEQIVKVLKNNTSLLVGEEGKTLQEYLEKKMQQIANLQRKIEISGETIGNWVNEASMTDIIVGLGIEILELKTDLLDLKTELLETACAQAPSCANRSPLEALGTDDGSRNRNPGSWEQALPPDDPAFSRGGSTPQ